MRGEILVGKQPLSKGSKLERLEKEKIVSQGGKGVNMEKKA